MIYEYIVGSAIIYLILSHTQNFLHCCRSFSHFLHKTCNQAIRGADQTLGGQIAPARLTNNHKMSPLRRLWVIKGKFLIKSGLLRCVSGKK